MQIKTLESAIDAGAELCGSQNKLATQLGMKPGNLSAAKNGRRDMTDAQLIGLARLLEMEPGELWMLAQERKNPFRTSAAATLSAWLVACLAVILSAIGTPAEASIGAASQPVSHDATVYTLSRLAW